MSIDLEKTIAALATAQGSGPRAIIRLSGPDVLTIVQSMVTNPESVTMQRQRIEVDLSIPVLTSHLPADLYLWKAPHTFTGQDLSELHFISSPPLIELVMAELFNQGAVAAQPGEMTMRAFLNGKLDLTRAEAVLAVIDAGSRAELKQALIQLAGGMAHPLQSLRDDLLNLLADIEAELDFADEDISFVNQEALLTRVASAMAQVTLLSKQVESRSTGDRAFRVVLSGKPNVGKSSLFNLLSEASSALVSEEAGTTRDYLVSRLVLEGMDIDLVDTAGWQSAGGAIEEQSQNLGMEQTEQADLILFCVEAGKPIDADERSLLEEAHSQTVITKCDKAPPDLEGIATSVFTRKGLDELKAFLVEEARAFARPALAPNLSRCRHHITESLEHLRRAHSSVLFEDPREILALELRGALDHLGEMAGAIYTDDLLDRIFSRFCIGK